MSVRNRTVGIYCVKQLPYWRLERRERGGQLGITEICPLEQSASRRNHSLSDKEREKLTKLSLPYRPK